MSLRPCRPDGPPQPRRPSPRPKRSGACAASAHPAVGLQDLFDRQRRLVELAQPVMERLLARLGTGRASITLTDPHGTVLQALGSGMVRGGGPTAAEAASAERAVATADRRPAICWAVCIFDPSKRLLGRLQALVGDPGTVHRLSSMVRLSARTIENRWFDDTYRYGLRLHFHPRGALLGSGQEARVAIGPDGLIAGANSNALALLATGADGLLQRNVKDVFGIGLAALLASAAAGIDGQVVLELNRKTERSLFAQVRLDWPAPWLRPATMALSAGSAGSRASPPERLDGSIRTPVSRRSRRGRVT